MSALPVPVDSRRDPRHLTVLIVGKVRGAQGELPCVVNDVSSSGLQARFSSPPALGARLTFSLRGLPERQGVVRWVDGLRAGVEFDQPLDLGAIVSTPSTARTPRGPRFACNRSASLILNGRGRAIDLLDVSLGGAKLGLQPPAADAVGRPAMLILPVIDEPRAGTVRWHRDDRMGFQFVQPLHVDTLTKILNPTLPP